MLTAWQSSSSEPKGSAWGLFVCLFFPSLGPWPKIEVFTQGRENMEIWHLSEAAIPPTGVRRLGWNSSL